LLKSILEKNILTDFGDSTLTCDVVQLQNSPFPTVSRSDFDL